MSLTIRTLDPARVTGTTGRVRCTLTLDAERDALTDVLARSFGTCASWRLEPC